MLFTGDVQTACDAYEMFLQDKKLPLTAEDIAAKAAQFKKQTRENAAKASAKKLADAQKLLTGASGADAVKIAIEVLKKHSPQSLAGELQ